MIAAIPMSAIFSSSSKDDPVAAASRFHNFVFIAYIVILVLAALFQWWVWSTGNKLQDAIRANSDARIEEAKAEGAKANERALKLENENLKLSGQVAGLETAASNAIAAQQKVEIELTKQSTELARQKELTAKAEKELFELKERIQPRRISPAQKARLVAILSHFPKGKVSINCTANDGEAYDFAKDILAVLEESGWPTEGINQGLYSNNPRGIAIVVKDSKSAPPYAGALQQAFFAVGIPLAGAENPHTEEGAVLVVVGRKP
jgi:hypothetical protein